MDTTSQPGCVSHTDSLKQWLRLVTESECGSHTVSGWDFVVTFGQTSGCVTASQWNGSLPQCSYLWLEDQGATLVTELVRVTCRLRLKLYGHGQRTRARHIPSHAETVWLLLVRESGVTVSHWNSVVTFGYKIRVRVTYGLRLKLYVPGQRTRTLVTYRLTLKQCGYFWFENQVSPSHTETVWLHLVTKSGWGSHTVSGWNYVPSRRTRRVIYRLTLKQCG
jgi:hypothetical protein